MSLCVDILMCTYNHKDYIAQAIESIILQKTNFNFRVLIGDDFSIDGTQKIIEEYKKKYYGLIFPFFRSENLGVQENAKLLLESCKAKYIALCDGDDYWTDPYKLQKQVDFLEANPEYNICFHNAKIEDETGYFKNINLYSEFPWNILDTTRNEYNVEDLLRGTLCPTVSVVFRKPENFALPKWFSTIPFGDMSLFILVTKEKKIRYMNENWAVYRRHHNSVSRQQAGKDIFIKGMIRMYAKFYKELPSEYNNIIKEAIKKKVDELNQVSSINNLSKNDIEDIKRIVPEIFIQSAHNSINKKVFCTIITYNYIPYALTLLYSLIKIDKNIKLYVLITDSDKEVNFVDSRLKFYNVSNLEKDEITSRLKNKYSSSYHDAFRWSMKPVFMKFLLTEQKVEKLIYVDSDIHFYNDYNFLFDYLDNHNILLTPHWRTSNPLKEENNFKILLTDGIYNAGFVGANQKGIEALNWWAEACLYKCEVNYETGSYVDQKYLNFFHYLFDGVKVIKHKGCNVADWNQVECKRTINADRVVLINDKYPIIFIHFTYSTIKGIASGYDKYLANYLQVYLSVLNEFKEIFEKQESQAELKVSRDKNIIKRKKNDLKKGDNVSTQFLEEINALNKEYINSFIKKEKNKVLAIVCPQIGAISETFIRRHFDYLLPGKTVALTGNILSNAWNKVPTKIIPIVMGSYTFDKKTSEEVLSFLKEHSVSHILCEFGCVGAAVIELNKNTLNLPIYIHFHGQDASEFIQNPQMVDYYKYMGSIVNGVVAVSKPMAKRLIDVGIPKEKIEIIHYGVDFHEVNISNPQAEPCKFISVSRLVGKKGILYVLKAFEKAKKTVPNITLSIIGEGPLRKEIESFISEHNLENNITLYGEKDHNFVLDMMDKSSVFIQHSMVDPQTGNREGLPLSILEASAHGLPVISTFHEGIPEAIEHNLSGLLVEEKDWITMAEYIIKLAQNKELRKQMGIAGRNKILTEGFTTEASINNLKKLIGID